MQNKIICSNCQSETYYCLDEWGGTPFHLHCKKCHINIGATSLRKCEELFKEYHKEGTQLEYYDGKIKFLSEEGKIIINAEQ